MQKNLYEPLFLDIVKLSGATSAENMEGINEFVSSQIHCIQHIEDDSMKSYTSVDLNNFLILMRWITLFGRH